MSVEEDVSSTWKAFGVQGEGDYSDTFPVGLSLIQNITPRMLDALDKVRRPEHGPIVICDYGCSDGGTSLKFMKQCIDKIKAKFGAEQEILIVYDDLPKNDFVSVFANTQGILPASKADFTVIPGVSVLACGTSFYKQIFPSGFVHFAFSTIATHWLSKRYPVLPALCHHLCDKDTEGLDKLKEQAKRDWELFLLQRSKEIAPGARIIFGMLGAIIVGSEDRKLCSKSYPDTLMHLDIVIKQMIAEGLICKEEYENMFLPFFIQTLEEYESPFKYKDSPVLQSGLRLVSINYEYPDCPIHIMAKEMVNAGDKSALTCLIEKYSRRVKHYTFEFIYQALNKSRPEEEKTKLTEQIYLKLQEKIHYDPTSFGEDWICVYMEVTKD